MKCAACPAALAPDAQPPAAETPAATQEATLKGQESPHSGATSTSLSLAAVGPPWVSVPSQSRGWGNATASADTTLWAIVVLELLGALAPS